MVLLALISAACVQGGRDPERRMDPSSSAVPQAKPSAAATTERVAARSRVMMDFNGNGIDDVYDIVHGTSLDLDGNGFPDEVELPESGQ